MSKQEWIYSCDAGMYKEDSLIRLLVAIYKHRLHHLLNDGKWKD